MQSNITVTSFILFFHFSSSTWWAVANLTQKKTQDRREVKDALMAQAVALYLEELKQPVREKRKGLRTVCKEIEQAHLKEKGNYVKLDQTTLSRLAAGGKTKSQSNASKGSFIITSSPSQSTSRLPALNLNPISPIAP